MNFKKTCTTALLVALSLGSVGTTAISASAKAQVHPHVSYARGAVAMDADTGKVVWSKNANTARPIASNTKVMTLYLALQKVHSKHFGWDSKYTVKSHGLVRMSRDDGNCGGFHFYYGEKLTIKQLYEAAYLDSSNNSAIALGQWVSGSNGKFIKKMNSQAHKWGLKHTHFVSASGLENWDLRHYGYAYGKANANKVSPKDLAIITRHLVKDYPVVLKTGLIGSMHVKGQRVYNYNNLLKGRKYYDKSLHVDGLKTGYTPLAGYCFVGTAKKPGHHRVITVVLHDENEFTETKSMMRYAFNLKSMKDTNF